MALSRIYTIIWTLSDKNSLKLTTYEVLAKDYVQVIKLNLVVAERINEICGQPDFDKAHYVYGNYHINYDRNVGSAFLRSYYLFEYLAPNQSIFNSIKNEYRDYYTAFVNKFEYTPAQYLSTIFWELSTYFQEKPCLAYRSLWKKVDAVYGKTPLSKISKRVVADISRLASEYCNWNDDTLDALWDFSDFVSYPFITDGNGNYLSVSNYTLKNGFFEKLYWMIRECYPDEGAECMSFFGRLFERYIQDLTRDAVDANESKQIVFTDEFSIDDDRRSSDAYIQRDDKLIIIEVKGYSILQNTLKKNEQNSLNIKKLYLDPVTEADWAQSQILCKLQTVE